jgi:RNA polymerase sigma-70 factor, ECF subfamily
MIEESSIALETLIKASARGNRAAFQALYEATSARLYGAAMRLLRDHGLAQDALQEGFLKIWRNAEKFDATKGSAMSWMGIIVRRAALDRMNRLQAHDNIDDIEIAAPAIEPSNPKLNKCLKTLSETQGNVLILSYVYGYTHDEIAANLDKPVGTIKSWVRRAGLALRECLEA